MASKSKYECYRCIDNGWPGTMVYLAGKDDQGKTLYVEDDGTAHQHKQKQGQQQESQTSTTEGANNPMPLLRMIDAKLERVITLLVEKEKFRLAQANNNVPQ